MGLFSRKDSAASRKPAGKPRPSVSSEAQAAELRVRARRRLAGAVALVMAAVVVLPMLLDSEPTPVSSNIAIKIPDRNAPFQPVLSDPAAEAVATPPAGSTQATPDPSPDKQTSSQTVASSAPPVLAPSPAPVVKQEPKPEPKPKPEAKPDPKAEAAKAAQANKNRSDDGARALALLEGRPTDNTNSAAAPVKQPTKGNFVVQALSLDSSFDAQTQRDKLSSSGVGNAFVDGPVVVNGLKKYRVRVGPFPSREAAQAAQTRLRTLGFGGAFITAQ